MLFHVGISERLHILTLRLGRQSAQMSKITNDCLTRSGTGCLIFYSYIHMATVGVKGLNSLSCKNFSVELFDCGAHNGIVR